MFGQRQLVRLLHCSTSVWNSSTKSHLAQLRKKTGYAFSNCKKALEINGNDLEKAEKWLHDQAQTLGWSKATSLGGRKTEEGLIAIMIQNKQAAMIELNCETDFVSRNKHFEALAQTVAKSCCNSIPEVCVREGPVSKVLLNKEKLSSLPGADGKTLGDNIALAIGLVGENMTLKRAALLNAAEDIHVAAYSHPASKNQPMLGKYGAIMALRQKSKTPLSSEKQELGRQLCQHVVGMNPSRIGHPDTDKPAEDQAAETVMIYQEFLLDPTLTVQEVLKENQLEIVDFTRFECGEDEGSDRSQNEPAKVSAAA